MNPDGEDFLLLAAYLDGELSPGEILEMERRLRSDPVLRTLRDELDDLSGSVRRVLAEPLLPSGFGAGLAAQFGNVETLPDRQVSRRWPSIAAALTVGLLGGGTIGYGISQVSTPPSGLGTIDAVYTAHLRGLTAPQPFDVASSDRHVVKPWFNGKTAVAPDAPDLAADGFPLVGGRVDFVDDTGVPTLVYRRRQHIISVTVVPKAGNVASTSLRREGSTIERWDSGDLSYFVVSDLNAKELDEFASLYRTRTAPQT